MNLECLPHLADVYDLCLPSILHLQDAFGTLFKPKYPIAQQYGDVARSLGLTSITNEDVNASFKAGTCAAQEFRLLADPDHSVQTRIEVESKLWKTQWPER